MISKERLLSRFLELTRIYSPSKGEKEMADWIQAYFMERGISFVCDECGKAFGGNGRNIVAHIPGSLPGTPIGLMAHMDQIEPCQNVNAIVEGDIVRTDGTTTLGGDDKGGIAAILEVAEDILETGADHRDVYLIFSVSEEIDMQGVKHMDMSMLPPMDILIVDAVGNTGIIAYSAPAKEDIRVNFRGRKAHAGIEPEKGINAIFSSAKAISNMRIGRLSPDTTSNIGRIEGGSMTNVVPDQVYFTAEIRSHDMASLAEEIAHMEKCCREAAVETNAEVDFVHKRTYPAFSVDPECELVQMLIHAMEQEGVEPRCVITGGGFDGNILAANGFRCVALSVGIQYAHTTAESLDINEACKCSRIMRRMVGSNNCDL